MTFIYDIGVLSFKVLTNLICRIDATQLAKIPEKGPLIIVTNHVNIIEIPIVYTQLLPRPIIGLASAHRWEKSWSRWLLELGEAIPLHRGEPDISAFRKALRMLDNEKIILIAPEGTRSGDGRLQKVHPGAVLLGLHSKAPLIPLVFYGAEGYRNNLIRLRRTDFRMKVGRQFTLDAGGAKVTKKVRQLMIDEVMYQLALQLPPVYRGYYSEISKASQNYLRFERINRI